MKLAHLVLAAAAALAPVTDAFAEDVSDLAGLLDEPVVSTASKSAETAGIAPATTSVISAEDLRRHGITSLDQAINFLGFGMMAEPSYATPEIGTRGVLLSGDYGNHVLLLLDGHALNEPWDGTAYFDRSAAIPFDLVDHVEVILGPGSVLYGSSAMLGVVNVITKKAKDYAGAHALADAAYPAEGRVAGGYGQQFELLGREGEVVAGVEVSGYRGPTLSFDRQPLPGGATWGGDATHRATEVPSGYLRLALGDFELALRGAASRRAAADFFGRFDDPSTWERDRWLSIDARWERPVSAHLRLGVRLYGDLYDYLANEPSTSAADCLEGQASCLMRFSGVSRWGGGEGTASWDWLNDGRYVLLAGLDVRYRHVTSWSNYRDDATGISGVVAPYDKRGTTLGAYLQQTLQPLRWLSLNAGLRLDRDDQLGSHLSPRLAAVVPAWSGGTVKAIYSEAFRAPSFFERYNADATMLIAAPDLRPETVRSVEGVVEQRVGADRLRLSLFRSWWSDLVVHVAATPEQIAAAQASGALSPGAFDVSVYANAARVDSYGAGLDWEGSGARRRLRYGAGLTIAHSSHDDPSGRSALPAAAEVFGNARVSYDLGARRPVLGAAARFVGPRPIAGTNFPSVPDAKAQAELHLSVSGPLAGELSYRIAATGALTSASAYAVGPIRAPEPGSTTQSMLPLPRYEVLAGLRYDTR